MGYRHIDNLYANQTILLEPECYALEKVHGTSAHISWRDGKLHFFSGEQQEAFEDLFHPEHQRHMARVFESTGQDVAVYGEAHGGKIQKQSWRYGPDVAFIAFEARIGDRWLTVPEADALTERLGLAFVDYVRIPTQLSLIDEQRDAPSGIAARRGLGVQRREGVVLRCIEEKVDARGNRIMAKHKRAEERETKTERAVRPDKAEKLKAAAAIADEWVTETRLDHVLQALGLSEQPLQPADIGAVVREMVADVNREGAEEFEPGPEANRAIGTACALLVKRRIAEQEEGI